MQNVVLIGMPGSGKSTAGVLAAKALGLSFLDTDLLLQQKTGFLLHAYIQRFGIDSFLDEEAMCLRSIQADRHIIATGGSAVLKDEGMAALQAGALCTIYLHLPPGVLEKRLTNIRTRGIAMPQGQSIRQLYALRAPLYEKYATHILHCGGQTVEETVEALTDLIQKIKTPADGSPRGN